MNALITATNNLIQALFLCESVNKFTASVLAAKTEEERMAIIREYIGGDDGVKREAIE